MNEFLATPAGYVVMQIMAIVFAGLVVWREIRSDAKRR